MEVAESVKNALETVGCYVPEEYEDFDVREIMYDSLSFISFIVEIETSLDISLPDEVLDFELLASYNGFVELIRGYVEEQKLLEVTV